VISFEEVYKSYPTKTGRHAVINGLTGRLPNKSIGILGGNGAGKSTLLRMLSGIERPDSGIITRHAAVSWPLGLSGGFNKRMSAVQNVKFVSRIYGQDTERILESVREFADIGSFFDMPMQTYSSGMRGRVAFGISLAIDFKVYLIDESISVGDKKMQQRAREAFRKRVDEGGAMIVIVSHHSRVLREYCEHGAILKDGKLTFFEDLEEAIEVHDQQMMS